jgi:UDP-GlcNAc:undecaprenyl-phosphate GlcNAc-1-phosphate transferase
VLFYLTIFAGSALLCLVLTPLALRLATRCRILDLPAAHKGHTSPIPYLGGLAIVLAFSVVVAGAALIRPPTARLDELLTVLGVGVALSVVGLFDDLRHLSALLRVSVEVAAGLTVWFAGIGVDHFSIGILNGALSVLWIVGVTNAFNLLDNMDGLSAGVAAIGAGWFFVIGVLNGQVLVAALAAALAGCALGFLRHNFHPARIYMGDAGSLFLGFVLAVLGLKLRFDGRSDVTFLVPILVLSVAIFDVALVTVCRLRAGRSPFRGGLDHTSHRLVFIGIPVRVAVALIYSWAIGTGIIALVVSRVDPVSAYLLAGLMLLTGCFLAFLMARVPVYRGRDGWREMVGAAQSLDVSETLVVRNRQTRMGSLFGPQPDLREHSEVGPST